MAQHATDRKPEPPYPEQHQPKPGREADLAPRPEYEAPAYRAAGKLVDRVALVTGGDSGIGRAVAVLFAREGADVAFTCLPQERDDAEETLRVVGEQGRRAHVLVGDLADEAFCRRAIDETVAELGRLDILVNNAAYQQHQPSLEDLSDEQWDHTFRTNITAYFRLAKAALPHLSRGSSIINTTSVTAFRGSEDLLDYSATKGAIVAFTRSLARNLVDRGIRVNGVAPGPVWTPLNPSDAPPEEVAHFGEKVPMGRPAQPEEIAPAYVYLASEADSSYVTGEVIALLGGEIMGR